MAIIRTEILDRIRTYIARDVLDGKDIGLDHETPLLEWGVINSFEIVQLLSFLSEEFQVEVPTAHVVAANFQTINALADLVTSLRGE